MSGEDATTAERSGPRRGRAGDPRPVLTRLAEQCVPALSDSCTIEFRDADGSVDRIVRPASPTATAMATAMATAQTHEVELGAAQAAHLGGTAVFAWDARVVAERDRELLTVLVEHAVQTVALQRAELEARAAELEIRTLKQALENSRGIGAAIGILMNLHKIDTQRALAILRAVSQHHNRRLRDLAAGVVTTGWLDPALMASTPGVSVSGGRGTVRVLQHPVPPPHDVPPAATSMACAGRHG